MVSEGLFIAPDWLASADQRWKKGVMLGFDRRHTRGHIYRTTVSGMVHEADTLPPDSKNHAAYTRIYRGAYRDLESRLEGVLRKTQRL